MNNICLYGGSFDPVHSGHINFAKKIKQRFLAESLFFIPTFYSPFKGKTRHSSNEHRIKMLNIACEDIPGAKVSLVEIEREGFSYTEETLHYFKLKFPNNNLYWIIGDDHINNLHQWKGYPDHFKYCDFIVLPRSGKINAGMLQSHPFRKQIHFIKEDIIDVSSTDIRKAISEEKNIDELVPQKIKDYILANKLYR